MFNDFKKRQKSHIRVGSSSEAEQDDTHYYRCKVCGWPCNSKTVEVAGPRPNASDELTGVVITDDADGDPQPSQPRGCPNCGTFYSR